MNFNPEPLILGTEHLEAPDPSKSLWENRAAAYRMYDAPGVPVCTIAVTAYNRLQKTKTCVECILKYTEGVDYELLLIDNGSGDGTTEYFKTVPHGRKKIVRITKNIGFCFAWKTAKDCFSGKYLVIVSNDVYVTKNWLSNLLKCYESDPRIGFVEPVSNNVSNMQQVDLPYTNLDDMQLKAAEYNVSDPQKWEERLRCISLIGVYSRPVLDIIGLSDAAFVHDFTEDDLAARLRIGGYKLMLCRDTWVCHDHDFSKFSAEEKAALDKRLGYGRAAFREKHRGLDAWDDALNFELALLAPMDTYPFGTEPLRILVVDARCGTPVLEIRNRLRRRGLPDAEICAYTTRPKHYAPLQAAVQSVQCDRIEFLDTYYGDKPFDVVALCEPINLYLESSGALDKLRRVLKPRGLLLYKLYNPESGFEQIVREVKEEERIRPEVFPPSVDPETERVLECAVSVVERASMEPLEFREFDSPAELNAYFARAIKKKEAPRLSIAIMSHRNLESLKWCVESVLRFAEGIDYELVLMDNASEDEDATCNYMREVPFVRKKVIQMRGNMGAYFNAARGWSALWDYCGGDYILHLNDDHIVTENAVQNMIRALDTDPSIGMVNPTSSNAWMMQDPQLTYSSREEMFEAAKAFNVYDPRKWEERVYVAAVAWMFRREVLHCLKCANPFGPEFSYDLSLRLAGYRVMLLGDTWVHHNHDYTQKESYGFAGDTPEKNGQRECIARSTNRLFFGLTLFEDICVFEKSLASQISPPQSDRPRLLSLDVRAGQGLIDLKNALRSYGVFDTQSTAFCTQAKYYPLLYTLADEVLVEPISALGAALGEREFDYCIAGTPLNLYEESGNLLNTLLSKLKPGGELLYKLREGDAPYTERLLKAVRQ